MSTETRKMTYAEYALLPNDGKRYEVIDGEMYVSPSPFDRHQVAVGNVGVELREHVTPRGLGRVRIAPLDALLGPHTIVQPDVLFVSAARLELLTPQNFKGAPDLVVEVLSHSTAETDRGVKCEAYARAGVREYWLADPDTRTLEVLVLDETGKFVRFAYAFSEDQEAISSILPDFTLTPREAFED